MASSTIIRATDRNRGTQHVAFNFDDMTAQANNYLGTVRAEAAKIVEQAKQEAQTIRQQAEQAGHQAAMRSVEQAIQKELATVLPALRQVIQDIHHAKQAWLRHWESAAIHVSTAIAQRVIRRELSQHPEITVNLVREAMELASRGSHLRIYLNPQDHEAIAEQVDTVVKELRSLSPTEVVTDAGITKGGCRVETEFGVVDQQFESQLKRIEEELMQ